MTRVYSTEDLIQILAAERRACINGERLNINASPSGISPFLDMFLTTDGIQKLTAYNDFKATIHHYQQEHQVSGLVWQELGIRGQTLCYPRVHDQLISLPQDLLAIQAAKAQVIDFWYRVTDGMAYYLSLNGGKAYHPIAQAEMAPIEQRSQWATLLQQGKGDSLEVILQLGWGKPEAAHYRQGWPDSGSEYLHAVLPGRVPLG